MVSSTQYSACISSTWHRSSPRRRGVVIQLCVRSGSHHQAHGGVLLLLLLGYADNDTLVPAPNILSVSCSHHSHHNNTIQHSSYLRNRTGTVKLRSIWLWFTPPLLCFWQLSLLSYWSWPVMLNFIPILESRSTLCIVCNVVQKRHCPMHPSSRFKMLSPSVSRLTWLQLHIFSQQFLHLFTIIFSQ